MCGAADESDHQTERSEHQRDRVESVESRLERERGSPILASCDRDEETGDWRDRRDISECGERPPPNLRTFKSGAAYEIATEFVVLYSFFLVVNRHGRRRRTAEPRRVALTFALPRNRRERAPGRGSLAAHPARGGRPADGRSGVPPARGLTYRFWHALWPTSMAHTPLDVSVTRLRSTSRARAHDLPPARGRRRVYG